MSFNPEISDLKPKQNYLFVIPKEVDVLHTKKKEEKKIKTSTGFELITPDEADELEIKASIIEMAFGEVISVSPEAKEDLGVEKGDIVTFGALSGRDASIQGVEYRILRASDIIATV